MGINWGEANRLFLRGPENCPTCCGRRLVMTLREVPREWAQCPDCVPTAAEARAILDAERLADEPCVCDTDFTCMAADHRSGGVL